MFRWGLIVVLTISIIGTIIWGYQEHQDKNAILIQAENNYQRAFHDLTYRIDLLSDKISTVLATNSPEQLSPQLAEIWKVTSEAHAAVGHLPLTLLPFNKTEEFLTNIGDFSYRVAIRRLDEDPLNEDEIDLLNQLHEKSNEIKRELRTVQYQVINEGLRWMDVELALATNEPADNTIIDGLKTIEKNSEQFAETDNEGGFSFTTTEDEKEIKLEGKQYNEQEIEQFVRERFKLNDDVVMRVSETGDGSDIPMYHVTFETDELYGYADVTKQGANMISYLLNRDINERKIGLHEGMNKASELLNSLGYENVEVIGSAQYEHIGVFQFVYVNDEQIYFHPDTIQVKVALDNGDILGLSARDYIINQYSRDQDTFTAKLSEEEAINKVNPNIDIQETRLSVIENDLGEEVLTYELIGTMNENTYRVYINSDDGFEERVELLKQKEELYQ
ncbi:germination protein YpeB [Bacillaceae bacterium W0354]